MKRRNFLSAATAVVATPVAAFQAPIIETPEPDPIRDWLDQWRSARAEWLSDGFDEYGDETAHGEELWDKSSELEAKIYAAKPQTQDGAAAQIEWMLSASEDIKFQEGHREALEMALAFLKGASA